MFIFLNYNIAQAGNRPWATEWPLGKSSSILLPCKFPSHRVPPLLILGGNSKSQEVSTSTGKAEVAVAPVIRCPASWRGLEVKRLHLPAATTRLSAQA